MIPFSGYAHIILSIIGIIMYLFLTLLSFAGRIYYKPLTIANIIYAASFIFGMIWAKQDWNNYLLFDSKIILSFIIIVPFVIENKKRTGKWYWMALGTAFILLNYILPLITGTIHTH